MTLTANHKRKGCCSFHISRCSLFIITEDVYYVFSFIIYFIPIKQNVKSLFFPPFSSVWLHFLLTESDRAITYCHFWLDNTWHPTTWPPYHSFDVLTAFVHISNTHSEMLLHSLQTINSCTQICYLCASQ